MKNLPAIPQKAYVIRKQTERLSAADIPEGVKPDGVKSRGRRHREPRLVRDASEVVRKFFLSLPVRYAVK